MKTFDEWWEEEYPGMSYGYGAEDAWNAAIKEAHQGQSGATTGYTAKDVKAARQAWNAVWDCCVELGMDPAENKMTSIDQVCEFIRGRVAV